MLERLARRGELVLIGYPDLPPLVSAGADGRPEGYALLLADRIAAELGQAVGRPLRVRFQPTGDPRALIGAIAGGSADLACGLPFSWDQDMLVDHTLAIGLSGLRLLAPAGRFDGNPAALAGRRIGVVRNSLAQSELLGMQPRAKAVPFATLEEALTALQAGRVEGVVGDSVVLAGLAQKRGASGWILTPELPYEVYAVTCVVPPNASTYRHLVNLAIARLQQQYLEGQPEAVNAVNRWLGPGSAIGIPQARLEAIFEAVQLGVETLRPLPSR